MTERIPLSPPLLSYIYNNLKHLEIIILLKQDLVTDLVTSHLALTTPNTNATNQSTQPHPQQHPTGGTISIH